MLMVADSFGLDSLQCQRIAHVAALDEDGGSARDVLRLRELGFYEGVDVELLHRGLFGTDPLAVRVGNNVVALRRKLARLVRVSAVGPLPFAEAAE